MAKYQEKAYTIEITIDKPIYGSYVAISEKYLRLAKNTGKKLVITTNEITGICTYKEWMDGAKRMEKEFLIKDHPMILWANHVSLFVKEKPEVKQEVVKMDDMFSQFNQDDLLKVREKLKK